jgi:DNA-binding transcriptional MerR regulator
MEKTDHRFVTIGAAAAALGIAPSTLRLWEQQGIVPPAERTGGAERRLYAKADIDALRPIAEERRRAKTAIAV